MPEKSRQYKKSDLVKAFRDRGRWCDHKWILKQESAGRLRCPRMPHNNWRVFTKEEIGEIVAAFSPGGKGYWFFGEE